MMIFCCPEGNFKMKKGYRIHSPHGEEGKQTQLCGPPKNRSPSRQIFNGWAFSDFLRFQIETGRRKVDNILSLMRQLQVETDRIATTRYTYSHWSVSGSKVA